MVTMFEPVVGTFHRTMLDIAALLKEICRVSVPRSVMVADSSKTNGERQAALLPLTQLVDTQRVAANSDLESANLTV